MGKKKNLNTSPIRELLQQKPGKPELNLFMKNPNKGMTVAEVDESNKILFEEDVKTEMVLPVIDTVEGADLTATETTPPDDSQTKFITNKVGDVTISMVESPWFDRKDLDAFKKDFNAKHLDRILTSTDKELDGRADDVIENLDALSLTGKTPIDTNDIPWIDNAKELIKANIEELTKKVKENKDRIIQQVLPVIDNDPIDKTITISVNSSLDSRIGEITIDSKYSNIREFVVTPRGEIITVLIDGITHGNSSFTSQMASPLIDQMFAEIKASSKYKH